jgi:hypothetical protein
MSCCSSHQGDADQGEEGAVDHLHTQTEAKQVPAAAAGGCPMQLEADDNQIDTLPQENRRENCSC